MYSRYARSSPYIKTATVIRIFKGFSILEKGGMHYLLRNPARKIIITQLNLVVSLANLPLLFTTEKNFYDWVQTFGTDCTNCLQTVIEDENVLKRWKVLTFMMYMKRI